MRQFQLSLLLLACMLAAAPSAQRTVATRARSTSGNLTITVVATTDLHGGVLPRGNRGGLENFGGYVRNIRAARAADGGAVLLVDSGDMFQGTLESNPNEGAAVTRAYNGLGYAAAAIGNHEFDYGPVGPDEIVRKPGEDPRGALKARAAQARFPFLAANIVDEATGKAIAWPNVKPSVLLTVGGVKVGLIGVTTIDTPTTSIAANMHGLTFAPLAPVITREATALRQQGATIIIVLAHAGGACTTLDDPQDTSSCNQMAEIVRTARDLPAGVVDMIAAGHTHQAIAQEFGAIPIVQAYSSGRSFSRVDLTVNRSSGHVVATHLFPPKDVLMPSRYESRQVRPDATAAAAIAPAVAKAREIKNQPLGVFAETPFARGTQQDETSIADLTADAMLGSAAGADVAFTNGGGLRADIPAGPVTYGEVYEVNPFDNRLVTLSLTGDQLTRIVAYTLTRRAGPTELLALAGVSVSATCKGGMLDVELTRPSGARIRPDERLTAATTDFVATGGDGIMAPAGPLGALTSAEDPPVMREEVVTWLRRRGGRLNETQFIAPQARRWRFPGARPVMCQ